LKAQQARGVLRRISVRQRLLKDSELVRRRSLLYVD
jgi:hypothetical protein